MYGKLALLGDTWFVINKERHNVTKKLVIRKYKVNSITGRAEAGAVLEYERAGLWVGTGLIVMAEIKVAA